MDYLQQHEAAKNILTSTDTFIEEAQRTLFFMENTAEAVQNGGEQADEAALERSIKRASRLEIWAEKEKKRQALLLHRDLDWSLNRIAKLLLVTHPTVKRWIADALKDEQEQERRAAAYEEFEAQEREQ